MPHVLTCPECGSGMVLRTSSTTTHHDGTPRRFYGCTRFPVCYATCSAHADGRPMGFPTDAATRTLRHQCHLRLDQLWRGGGFTREDAYLLLGRMLNLSYDDAHIGMLNADQCHELIQKLDAYLLMRGPKRKGKKRKNKGFSTSLRRQQGRQYP